EPLLLFLIIFFWTPPHFWALALFRSDDYARAGIPMLPVVAGPDAPRLQILLYTIVLVAIAVAPWPLGYFDAIYGITSLVLGAGMMWLSIEGYRPPRGKRAPRATRPPVVCLLDPVSLRTVRDPPAGGRGPRGRTSCGPRGRTSSRVGGAWKAYGRQSEARWNRPHRGAEKKPPPALDRHCARARRSRRAVLRGHHGQGAGRSRPAHVVFEC